jgi:hypothetical protein
MDGHHIRFIERLRAIGAFTHAIGDTILNTAFAECVPTNFDGGVLKLVPTDCT